VDCSITGAGDSEEPRPGPLADSEGEGGKLDFDEGIPFRQKMSEVTFSARKARHVDVLGCWIDMGVRKERRAAVIWRLRSHAYPLSRD